jgi:hypothetical protein
MQRKLSTKSKIAIYDLQELLKEGLTQREISKRMGVTEGCISKRIVKWGLDNPKNRNHKNPITLQSKEIPKEYTKNWESLESLPHECPFCHSMTNVDVMDIPLTEVGYTKVWSLHLHGVLAIGTVTEFRNYLDKKKMLVPQDDDDEDDADFERLMSVQLT